MRSFRIMLKQGVRGMYVHDDYIVNYNVDLQEKKLTIQTYNNYEKRKKKIVFSDVLTHLFKGALEWNQVLDIFEREISCFVKDNQKELQEMEGYCWPICYQTEQELFSFLNDNKYKYIIIDSSYGMSGWVLAKSFYFES